MQKIKWQCWRTSGGYVIRGDKGCIGYSYGIPVVEWDMCVRKEIVFSCAIRMIEDSLND